MLPIRSAWTAVLVALFGMTWRAPAEDAEGPGRSKDNLDLPFDVEGPGDPDDGPIETIVFYGSVFEGDGLFFCLDRSRSTQDEGELYQEQKEAIRAISEFSGFVQFGLVFYDAGVIKWPASGRPAEATSANKSLAKAFILNTPGGSGTCVQSGILECLDFVLRSSAQRNVIIVLTDGCTTCGDLDPASYAAATLAEVKARNHKRAQISSICVGRPNEVCEAFPKALAAQNRGSYTRVAVAR